MNTRSSINLDFLIRESAAVYHGRSRDVLTSHGLADFRRCPLLFRRKRLGLIPDRDSAAFALGRAAHTLILEGRERFEAEYAVGGPINPRTGKPFGPTTKAFTEWSATIGKDVLSDADAGVVEQMNAAVRGHELALDLLADGVAEGVVRGDYLGHASQSRIDWLNPDFNAGVVDLKTADRLDAFELDIAAYRYPHQLAFYRRMVELACGVRPAVHVIAVEKREPYRCGVWRIPDAVLDDAQAENESAMAELARCQADDRWPTRYESLRLYDPTNANPHR